MTNGHGRFEGAIALVTGAGSGIGAAVAKQLASEGAARVYALDVNDEALIREYGEGSETIVSRVTDVSSSVHVNNAVAAVLESDGRLDVVVHAAGIDDPEAKRVMTEAIASNTPIDITADLTDEQWRRLMAVNLDGTFHVVRAAVAAMKPKGGAIVVIGSSSVFDTLTGYPHYAASKAAVHAFCQAVAKEVLAFGIRVNVVAPGPTDTGMAARTPDELKTGYVNNSAVPYAAPDEIADNVLFLASEQARNVVGAVLLSNRGRFTV
ncbi:MULTISPECIES: SDR family NAD(P)-dependent oxidoreductase [Rhodococcus]|uniref:SDR family NAD(P)-dependent oxidoreductase n=1 Tax=Rhodococcus TaxID=1827 RepID=UPI000EAA29A9|nr:MULTISPECIES: SDR family NAD(P)-dependent oxidoreductase [Rhodococcus]MDI9941461.1 SDR family NAD(P)-dependent oxidoreductase [Rhodococcus sp. IEGM 1351]QZS59040.1 SDR family oxidoreductase [Rhodococcus opacus]RKM74385.1 oxidoreductase [Rhodococcus opacus]UNM99094.1 SDR family oxidoreductase [Rhodococcus opacus]UZG55038.1 SDR family oxidoreductase [Rhodococcus opacus]